MSVDLLLRQIDTHVANAEVIRENFRRLQQYLKDSGLDDLKTLQKTIIQGVPINPSIYNKTDEFDTVVNNQSSFTLSATPKNPSNASRVLINGVALTEYGYHFTISGNILTLYPANMGYSLEVLNEFGNPDRVVVNYMI